MSILSQNTNYSYELIIVNDGATDETDSIIREIKDKRIKYIIQENQGLSGARNTGLNHAQGKYVMFVDSDDVLCENSINDMLDLIKSDDADIVCGGYYTFNDKNNAKQYFIREKEVIQNNPHKAVLNFGFAWGKIYKREIFNSIRFPMKAWYEDTIVCSVIYRMCKNIVVLDKAVYGYRENPKGISRTARASKKCLDHYWVMEDAIEQANRNGIKNDYVLYELVVEHMSTYLYRRISLLDEYIIECTFIMARNMLKEIRQDDYNIQGGVIKKDIEYAFEKGNYKLWKLASFIA